MNRKEADFMNIATTLRQDEVAVVKELREFYLSLKKQMRENPEQAKKEAREALIRTGVIQEDGSQKDKIVSWE